MKNLKALLEDIAVEMDEQLELELAEASDFPPEKGTPPAPKPAPKGGVADEGEDDDDESTVADHAPDGKGHYTADDLREIIDYVRDVLKKEDDDAADDADPEADPDDDEGDDGGDIGLDLWYEYADMLPETVINQVVDDLKDTFEIEDTMLEAIIAEGSSFFSRSQKGPAAKAARKAMRAFYRKNKAKLRKRNKLWRASEMGVKMAKLHRKAMGKGGWLGKITGKRIVSQV